MCGMAVSIDPFNDNNHFIFGSNNNNNCWYFNNKNKPSYIQIESIPKHKTQKEVRGHACAMFETENNNKYVLIYGGEILAATYNIYNLKMNKWDNNAIKLNKQWFIDQWIMYDGHSEYGFGSGLSMITDLFEKNKIHIIGGCNSYQKYGYFEFNEQIINNCDLSCVFFFCLLDFFSTIFAFFLFGLIFGLRFL